jgi:signal transduction histidine kinase/ligand-binding sensor domain-containing protein
LVAWGGFIGAVAKAPAAYHVRYWSSEDGLPANRITGLAQTRDGYLWVGTWFGLARFDGVRFVVFNSINTPELQADSITALAVDAKDGSLWIGSRHGLLRLKDGQFERLPETEPVARWDVSKVIPSSGGGVWLRSGGKVTRWRGSATPIAKLGIPIGEHGWDLYETEEGDVIVATGDQLVRVTPEGVATNWALPPEAPSQRANTGLLLKDRTGRLWYSTQRQVSSCREGVWRMEQTFEERDAPSADRFLADGGGGVWAAYQNAGLWRHSPEHSELVTLGERGAEKAVTCMIEDREGQLWAGTTYGLFKLRSRFIRMFGAEEGLPHRECWSVAEAPDGAVWVETHVGLARITGERVETFRDEPSRKPAQSVLVDREGRVWSGFTHNGVVSWLPGRETNRFWSKVSLTGIHVTALYNNRSGQTWVGTSRGPAWMENGRPASKWGQDGLPVGEVQSIYQTRDGAMWFGVQKSGVVRWIPPKPWLSPTVDDAVRTPASTTRYTESEGLADNRVFAFHEDADGVLWLATHNGLSRFKDGRFFNFTTAHGLVDNLINWLEEDDAGRFWFSCNRGIFRIERRELNAVADGRKSRLDVAVYGSADGMLSPETNGEHQPAGCKTRDGRLWFPTPDGVAVIDPNAVETEASPPVVIERVVIDGEAYARSRTGGMLGDAAGGAREKATLCDGSAWELPRTSAAASAGLNLSPGRAQTVEFHFTANALAEPKRVRFRYRLEGHDNDWREDSPERVAYYTNLRPGPYRFEVKAVDHRGRWSEVPAAFVFQLEPHFYQTWPFYILCGAAAMLVTGGFTAYRLRWQRRLLTAWHDRSLSDERARIARDLHDELGTALTGVALELDLTGRQSQDGVASRLGESASRVRTLAERMREVVWAVNPRCDTVSSLASFLEQQAGALLRADRVRSHFEFPEDIPALPLSSETRHQLALAVREALTNTLRHADATEVLVRLALDENYLSVSVRDNGKGFDVEAVAARADGAHGLQNLRTRLEGLGGRFIVESKPGAGTRIEFRVPLPT